MAAGTASPRSPRAPGSPVLGGRQQSSTSQPILEDSSADELTGFISRSNYDNYQSLHTTQGSVPRSRKSSTRSRRSTVEQPATENGMEYTTQDEQEQEEHKESWWKSQLQRFQSIELENKGSVARDHLAIGTALSTLLLLTQLT